MNAPDRWQRVEELFAALLDASAEERRTALDSASSADVASDVETLLRNHDQLVASGSGFLERLDSQRAAALVEATDTGPDVAVIGRYPVVRRLGRGGMGVVYLARDTRLDRLVALKLLPDYRSSDAHAVDRLSAEARTASALDHPNIGTIHEIAESEDGRLFIAMAYYEGETLRERMARGPIPVEEVLRIGVQLAEGLSAAHLAGVVHRDIKPENLIITEAGLLKIVDFGIATAITDDPGRGGPPRGTPAYMSPEQARGEPTDQRTDIWSAGVVLHEMLAGVRPHDHTRSAPARSAPPALTALVKRSLEPDPDRRLESAALLATELRAIGPRAGRRRLRMRIAGGALVAAAAGVWAFSASDRAGPAAAADVTADPGIAILPFEVHASDLELWREGMVDLIGTNLDGVAGLRAIDSRTVLAGWRELERDGPPDFGAAVAFARRTGAAYAVFGSVASSGGRIRISARVHPLEKARPSVTVAVEGPADSIFSLVDRLSIRLLGAIWEGRERPDAQIGLARVTTSSLPALKAYLSGERAFRRADFEGAIAAYEHAVAADSTFAFALYHLAVARGWLGGTDGNVGLSTEAMQRAMRHAERLPERERLLLRGALELHVAAARDLTGTLTLLRTVTRRYPDDPEAWFLLGELAFHAGDQLLSGRAESEAALNRAVALDSGFAVPYIHLIQNAFEYRPDSGRAARLVARYRSLAPESPMATQSGLALALAFGDSARRQETLADLAKTPATDLDGWTMLHHPRFWRVGLAAMDAQRYDDVAAPVAGVVAANRFRFNLGLGRVRAAYAALSDPRGFSTLRIAGLYQLGWHGLAVPDSVLDDVLATPATDTLSDSLASVVRIFFAGAHAADQRRWRDHAVGLARLLVRSRRLLASGDSASARFASGAAAALEGHGVRLRGQRERAYVLLSRAQRETAWMASMSRIATNETIRWWLGDLLVEMGRTREALRCFESFPTDPFAAAYRARLYEQLGEPGNARNEHLLVASAWSGADAELQPRVAEARAAAERLARR
jgi:serine/threonine-protein kinase